MLRSEGMQAQGCSFAASHLFWYISFNFPLAQQFTLAPSSLSWKLSPLNSPVHESSCCPTFCPLYSAEPSRPSFLVFPEETGLLSLNWMGGGVKKLICCLILKLAGPVGAPDPVRVVVNFNHGWGWSGIIVLGLSIPEGQSVAEVTASAATAYVCVCVFIFMDSKMTYHTTCRCGSVH